MFVAVALFAVLVCLRPRWLLCTSAFCLFCSSYCVYHLRLCPLFPIFVFLDVFSSPMWSEFSQVQDPSLRLLANKLPEMVLSARADSTTATYLNGFKRWRSWASRFPEISVLPANPAYVSLYLLSVLQASTSPAPVQTALYSIRWDEIQEVTDDFSNSA